MTAGIVNSAKVTVLLSTYNGSKFLQQQLESLYQQTCTNIRILVRDDGSSDATRSILESEQEKGRIEILPGHDNLGPAQSFFALLKSAAATDTDYVAFCDQDDFWHPEKIARAVSALAGAADGPAMYCSRVEIVDEQLKHLGYTELPGKLGFGNALVENMAVGCATVLNRKAIELVGTHLPGKVLIHDWWCYLVVSCFGEIIFDEQATLKYRQHGNNTIGVATDTLAQMRRRLRRFFGSGEGYLWISAQASTLLEIFRESIPPAHRQVINNLVAAKSSWYRRIGLSLSGKIWRQAWSDNLLLRLLILLNRF